MYNVVPTLLKSAPKKVPKKPNFLIQKKILIGKIVILLKQFRVHFLR